MDKTRVHTRMGYVENYVLPGSNPMRKVYRYNVVERGGIDDPPPDRRPPSDLPLDLMPNGGLLLDVWPTGEWRWTDSISVTRTPYPHVQYTPCRAERSDYFDAHSSFQYRYCTLGWDVPTRKYYLCPELGWDAVYYQAALWNYAQGTLYKPTDKQIRQAQESALLNLWAGRPRQHMNVALALIELRDVKKTLTQFCEFSKFGIQLSKGAIKLPDHIRSVIGAPRIASLSCQKVAEIYLWYTFGVRPTIDDIKHFMSDVSRGRLVVGGRKRKPLLIGRTYANGYKSVSQTEPNFVIGGFPWTKTQSGTLTATNAGTPYKYAGYSIPRANLKGFTIREVYGKVFAKVRAQGKWTWKYFPSDFAWSCPLFRTAWELVPFSFVIDWFLDVGKSIQRLDNLSWVATTRFAFEEPWLTVVQMDKHYAPVCKGSATAEIWNLRQNGTTARADWKTYSQSDAWYELESIHKTFWRGPASEKGLSYASLWRELIPDWQGKLKAYQITSGMALLESIGKLI